MTITVNGSLLDMNIGCRTFISVSKLLELLKLGSLPGSIELNKQPIDRLNFASTAVNSGDKIVFKASPAAKKEK